MTFTTEPWASLDKWISVDGPVCFRIDNDDVDTAANSILIGRMLNVLNDNWPQHGIHAWRCDWVDADPLSDCEDRSCYWQIVPIEHDRTCQDCKRPMNKIRID